MPVVSQDLPVKALRDLFEAYHDHTSPGKKLIRERLIRRVGEKNAAETSLTAFELSVAAPTALRKLGWNIHEFVDIVIILGKPDRDSISDIISLSQSYITSPKRFNVIDVRSEQDGACTTCVTTVRRFRLKDVIKKPTMEVVSHQTQVTVTSDISDGTQTPPKIAQRKQFRAIYQMSNSSCSTVSTEDFKSTVSRVPMEDQRSLISSCSVNTYHTALSHTRSATAKKTQIKSLKKNDDYTRLLQLQGLWPVNPLIEQDWSGRGQHAEFQRDERNVIDDILKVHEVLGQTRTAIVESVRCRRILLARKTIWLGRRSRSFANKQQAIGEVAHITRLHHAHIVRVIGTYLIGTQLAILLYPVADYNLEAFLESMRSTDTPGSSKAIMFNSSKDFFGCLINATRYIHSNLVKHMDIKPQNILVRRNSGSELHIFTVLIADFGIARSYDRPEAIDTDGPTSFTRTYAAPEVVDQDFRGLAADMFSLGCVFLELFISLCDTTTGTTQQWQTVLQQRKASSLQLQWTHLQTLLKSSKHDNCPGVSYSSNIETLQKAYRAQTSTLKLSPTSGIWLPTICNMINRNPKERPTAVQLQLEEIFGKLACCDRGPCALESYNEEATIGEDGR